LQASALFLTAAWLLPALTLADADAKADPVAGADPKADSSVNYGYQQPHLSGYVEPHTAALPYAPPIKVGAKVRISFG